MISGECVVFFSMFAGGMIAGMITVFFLTLGGASKAARAVFDILTPLAVGAVFFFSLYDASGGVFRIYALVAFLLGGGVFFALYAKFHPVIKRILRRAIVPIKSLQSKVDKHFEPIRKRREKRLKAMREKRAEKKAISAARAEKRRADKARLRTKKREKKEALRRRALLKKRLRIAAKREGRVASDPSSNRQSH